MTVLPIFNSFNSYRKWYPWKHILNKKFNWFWLFLPFYNPFWDIKGGPKKGSCDKLKLTMKILIFLNKVKYFQKAVNFGVFLGPAPLPTFTIIQPNFNFAYRCLLPDDSSRRIIWSLSAVSKERGKLQYTDLHAPCCKWLHNFFKQKIKFFTTNYCSGHQGWAFYTD